VAVSRYVINPYSSSTGTAEVRPITDFNFFGAQAALAELRNFKILVSIQPKSKKEYKSNPEAQMRLGDYSFSFLVDIGKSNGVIKRGVT